MSEMNLVELFENNEQLTPLTELVHSIIDLDDEGLSDQAVELVRAGTETALTPKLKQLSIDGLIKSFAENNLTQEGAEQWIDEVIQQINQYVDSLNPSPKKREILNVVFEIFYDLFAQALNQYNGYDFELPIKTGEKGQVPTYAHTTDAAADIYAAETITLAPHSLSNKIKTDIKIALPEGWAAAILPRSSIGAKTGLRLSNSVGIIDSDYRGEIGVLYDNISDSEYTINAGDRIAQMIVFPVNHFKARVVDEVPETERGEGGFGSTGA